MSSIWLEFVMQI